MIARFLDLDLDEAAVLRTDTEGFLDIMKYMVEKPGLFKSNMKLSDGKPAPWFTGTDDGIPFICFAMSEKNFSMNTAMNTVNNFIVIFKEDTGTTENLHTVELRRSFGMSVPMKDKESCRRYAKFIRDLMKILSRMGGMDDIVHKAVGNALKLAGHDWTRDGMAKIL